MDNNDIKHIEINLGRPCNNLCAFCMIHDEGKGRKEAHFADLNKVKSEINLFSRKGYNSLGFLGGEPTIYPSLLEVVSYAHKKGFKKITIVSNGRRFSDKSFLSRLAEAGVTRFCISIHSHLKETEDRLTGVKGGFFQKVKGLENLRELRNKGIIKEETAISIVGNRLNYKTLIDSLSFFSSLGVRDFRLNFIRPEGRALSNFDTLVPRYSEIGKYLPSLFSFCDKKGLRLSLGDFPLCIIKNPEKNMRFVGELKDHINMVVSFDNAGRSRQFKETFLWVERRQKELKCKGEGCNLCIYNNLCEGPWKNYVGRYGFGEFKPIK